MPTPRCVAIPNTRDRRRMRGDRRALGVDPLIVGWPSSPAPPRRRGRGGYLLAWAVIPAGRRRRRRARLAGRRASSRWRWAWASCSSACCSRCASSASGSPTRWYGRSCSWRPAPRCSGGSRPAGAATRREPRRGATRESRPPAAERPRERAALVSRTSLGMALVIAAGLVFLQATGALGAARDVLLAALVGGRVLGVIFAPWILRLVRSLAAERAERIRSQERAEMAAHLHDSVLQTLALVQKRADDPREVATLARRQERELRTGCPAARGAGGSRLVAALERRPRRWSSARRGGRGRGRGRPRRWTARRGAGGRRARGDGERGEVRRRRPVAVYAEVATGGRRCSCATAARASTPRPCRPTGAACASRSSGAWSATAAGPRCAAARRGHRGRARARRRR